MDKEHSQFQLRFEDIIPSSWFKKLDESSIWISCYKVIIPKDDIPPNLSIITSGNMMGVLIHGRIPFLDNSKDVLNIKNMGEVHLDGKTKMEKTSRGTYFLIILPFKIDDNTRSETEVRFKVSSFVGLLSAFNGRNMVYEKVFDNRYIFKGQKFSSFGPYFINPDYHSAPDISENRLRTIENALSKIEKQDKFIKNQIKLSLHWLKSAVFSSGVDAFTKYWIALEVLGMPDTTDIKPINESLSKIYELSLEETIDHFLVGRIFGLRCRILHKGQEIPIHQNLQDYLEALYVDLLFNKLDMPSEFRTQKVIDRQNFNLIEYLHE